MIHAMHASPPLQTPHNRNEICLQHLRMCFHNKIFQKDDTCSGHTSCPAPPQHTTPQCNANTDPGDLSARGRGTTTGLHTAHAVPSFDPPSATAQHWVPSDQQGTSQTATLQGISNSSCAPASTLGMHRSLLHRHAAHCMTYVCTTAAV
jgi:hypothetical protein